MKISIYDLLGMVKDGKAPKRIRIRTAGGVYEKEFYFDGNIYMYKDKYEEYAMTDDISIEMFLNDEVEILDDEDKEKGLPEKLKIEQDTPSSNYYIRNEYGTKCGLTKHSKIIADKLNEIIDYLEKQSKGE